MGKPPPPGIPYRLWLVTAGEPIRTLSTQRMTSGAQRFAVLLAVEEVDSMMSDGAGSRPGHAKLRRPRRG